MNKDIIIGSARIDEKGKLSGGAKGDSKQTNVDDYKGEVSLQTFYVHSKGWNVFRAKNMNYRLKLAERMKTACNNKNIGYDQGNRFDILSAGIDTKVKTECDCSSLVRQCIKEACGVDIGNFTTGSFGTVARKSGLFLEYEYKKDFNVETGDILCTKTKGHIVICVVGFITLNSLNPYSQDDLIADVFKILKVNNVNDALARSITVSKAVNKSHPIVTPLERYMRSLGYYTGVIEDDQGKAPCFGSRMKTAIETYQKEVVKSGFVDGVISAGGYTWKKLLKIQDFTFLDSLFAKFHFFFTLDFNKP